MRRKPVVSGLVYSFFVGCAFTGCMNDGGLNQNERQAGGGDDGVSVDSGEIAIDPTGQYLLSKTSDSLIHADLSTARVQELTGLSDTARVTFDHEGTSVFATRGLSQLPFEDDAYSEYDVAGELVRYDVARKRRLWSVPMTLTADWQDDEPATLPWLDVTEDDRFVIATHAHRVRVLDAATGELVKLLDVPRGIVDVDITPEQDRLVVTTEHLWLDGAPVTTLEIYDLERFEKVDIAVPNCSSELVISGQHAFLSPTRCRRDPVSVIDLDSERFVRNLPGFGPVALAKEGSLAVAFIDASNIEEALFDNPQQIPSEDDGLYHLMLIDTETLTFEVIALGDLLPRYAVTPDGRLLLIDADTLWTDGRIRVLDVNERELVPVLGPSMQLDHYAVTRDSSKVFLLDGGLFTIDLSTRSANAAPIDFTPTDLNLTPDDATLVLREDEDTLRLYDAQAGELLRAIELSEAP